MRIRDVALKVLEYEVNYFRYNRGMNNCAGKNDCSENVLFSLAKGRK